MKYRFSSLLLVCFACLAVPSFAQSGRTKPSPTPTPQSIAGPSVINHPMPSKTASPTASPTPKPKKDDSDDVIKVESALVPIPVSILDDRGRAVGALKLSDFELKVDGKPAEISDMTRSETPIRLAMLFDNSSSVTLVREFEKDAAVRFLRRVIRPEKDMAALFSVADYTRLEQALTKDVSQLTRAVETFPAPQGATALFDGIIEVADYLKSTNGRRVVVIVSDGEDTYSDLNTSLEDVIKALQMADAQVYVVRTKDFENFKRTGERAGNANIRALAAERRMIELAEQTGGAVFSPIDEREMKDAFDRISAELSQQYLLSYYPDDEGAKRGQFRNISVGIKSRPNVTLRTRKGYYVPKK